MDVSCVGISKGFMMTGFRRDGPCRYTEGG